MTGAPIKAFHVCFDHYIDEELAGSPELERAESRGGSEAEVRGSLESERGELPGSLEVEELRLRGVPESRGADLRVTPEERIQGNGREAPELDPTALRETPEEEWSEFRPELWKRGRRLAIQRVEGLLREANEKEGETSDSCTAIPV